MPISETDQKFMQDVAAYYEKTRTVSEPEGSIRETAQHFNINRTKVRKILTTQGILFSPITEDAMRLRERGLTIEEIAAALSLSPSTVSTYLPYTDKVDSALDPSPHTVKVREYRAYEKLQMERQAEKQRASSAERGNAEDAIAGAEIEERRREKSMDESWKKEWEKDKKMSYTETYHRPHRETWEDAEQMRKQLGVEDDPKLQGWLEQLNEEKAAGEAEWHELKDKADLTESERERVAVLSRKLGLFTGALNDRNRVELEQLSGEKLPFSPMAVMRLHLELCDPYHPDSSELDEETAEIFRRYGDVERDSTISRDIIVPSDLPLYALHYVIQKAFGWQNSHLHQFDIPIERAKALCHHNASMWSCLVGLIFRSPMMGEEDEFWTDDYTGGSFKNWLRKKYTGPYLSLNHGEGLIPCQEDMMGLDMNREFYVCYEQMLHSKEGISREYISDIIPVLDNRGKKQNVPQDTFRVKRMKLEQLPPECLGRIFDRDPLALIERLPIDSVLVAGKNRLGDYEESEICNTGEEMYKAVKKYIDNVIHSQEDTPEAQVCPIPFTDVLYYHYDFGDDWTIKITASWNCEDLMELISQEELDKGQIKCRELYRPVMIVRDGTFLIDDVGGIHGFADFLRTIHPDLENMDKEEKALAKQERKEYLEWAKGQGWKKNDATNRNFF